MGGIIPEVVVRGRYTNWMEDQREDSLDSANVQLGYYRVVIDFFCSSLGHRWIELAVRGRIV